MMEQSQHTANVGDLREMRNHDLLETEEPESTLRTGICGLGTG